MNILFFHNNGIIPTSGGISRITHTLTALFRRKGHRVMLVGAKKLQEYEYDDEQFFLPIGSLNTEDVSFLSSFIRDNGVDLVINQAAMVQASVLFIETVKAETSVQVWSCIHNSILTQVYNYSSQKEYSLKTRHLQIVFKILNTRLVSNLLTWAYIQKYRKFYIHMVNSSDKVILLSPGHKEELERMCGIRHISKAEVIPNCVKGNPIDNILDKKNIILWVGTIDFSVKRIDLMLQIWKTACDKGIGNWQLKVLGSSTYLEDAKRLASSLDLKNIIFEGRVNPDSYYKDAKVVCVTSTHESFSLVTIEGMRNGCTPFVFNSFPAASMIVSHGVDGVLVKPFNVYAFAEQLIYYCSSPKLLSQLETSSIVKSLQYDCDTVYNRWAELFSE